ncbi:MAG: hypothetical protein ACD_64C00261G0004 [uncultured bacterium]|nr:MAG: hypothetical protein ACD_64C00261G0004 [uncultured bacterium]
MKKTVIIAAVILLIFQSLRAERQEVFGRSFMLVRPASYNLAMNEQLWHNFVYHKSGPTYGAFQLLPFYQKSHSQKKVARYFLINGKNELLVAGDTTSQELQLDRDIRAEWLNLASDFSGRFSIKPQQKQLGCTFMYNQDLKNLIDISFIKEWGIGVEFPILIVENNLNLCQYDLQTTTTELNRQPDIISALNQCDWKYARWRPHAKSIIRPEKLKFTAGRSLMHRDYFQLTSSMSFSIPLTKKPNPKYLFNPVVGLDRHTGMGGAVTMQVLLNRNPERIAWSFFLNLEGTFFIRNIQHRTYDLKDKPFSRYMLYTRKNSAPGEVIPGANLLTLESVVRPYGVADFSAGWRINVAPFEFELGYDLFGFGGEKVRLRSTPIESPFNRRCGGLNEFGIAGSGTILECGKLIQATASQSTISCQAADDPEFVTICENDLDLCSAAAGSILNHKAHFAAGIEHMGDHMDGFGGFGCFVEFPQKNASLANWGFWIKLGGAF